MSQYVVSETSHYHLLGQCEAIIEEGLKTLEKIEKAFAIIEQMELYKEEFKDLDSYYKERWEDNIELSHLCQIQTKN